MGVTPTTPDKTCDDITGGTLTGGAFVCDPNTETAANTELIAGTDCDDTIGCSFSVCFGPVTPTTPDKTCDDITGETGGAFVCDPNADTAANTELIAGTDCDDPDGCSLTVCCGPVTPDTTTPAATTTE